MSEEEFAPPTEEAETETAEAAESEYENIDLNAALLEVMVKRTELLEKLAKGELRAEEFRSEIEAIPVPSLEKRRRRRRAA